MFGGISSLQSVISSLENRFRYNGQVEEKEEIINDKVKKKANKEDEEWVNEGKGFIDDSEIMENEDRQQLEEEQELMYEGFFAFRGPLINCVKSKSLKRKLLKRDEEEKKKRKTETNSSQPKPVKEVATASKLSIFKPIAQRKNIAIKPKPTKTTTEVFKTPKKKQQTKKPANSKPKTKKVVVSKSISLSKPSKTPKKKKTQKAKENQKKPKKKKQSVPVTPKSTQSNSNIAEESVSSKPFEIEIPKEYLLPSPGKDNVEDNDKFTSSLPFKFQKNMAERGVPLITPIRPTFKKKAQKLYYQIRKYPEFGLENSTINGEIIFSNRLKYICLDLFKSASKEVFTKFLISIYPQIERSKLLLHIKRVLLVQNIMKQKGDIKLMRQRMTRKNCIKKGLVHNITNTVLETPNFWSGIFKKFEKDYMEQIAPTEEQLSIFATKCKAIYEKPKNINDPGLDLALEQVSWTIVRQQALRTANYIRGLSIKKKLKESATETVMLCSSLFLRLESKKKPFFWKKEPLVRMRKIFMTHQTLQMNLKELDALCNHLGYPLYFQTYTQSNNDFCKYVLNRLRSEELEIVDLKIFLKEIAQKKNAFTKVSTMPASTLPKTSSSTNQSIQISKPSSQQQTTTTKPLVVNKASAKTGKANTSTKNIHQHEQLVGLAVKGGQTGNNKQQNLKATLTKPKTINPQKPAATPSQQEDRPRQVVSEAETGSDGVRRKKFEASPIWFSSDFPYPWTKTE